ncbi:MAG TPA: GNAT family N-acetyltransferase [Rhizomicrobium sp.]|nr:GNAT family N-acetyltransferase [Rhizomicrobium sp.]
MTLAFRVAVEDDIPAMSAIRLAVTENRLSDPTRITHAMYVDYLEHQGRSWVCEADGVIAGFASADKAASSVWALFVDPAHEGLGIGQRLLALVADYLFALGHQQIVLSTSAGTRADRFYAAQGWQRGTMKNDIDVEYALSKPREYSHVDPA